MGVCGDGPIRRDWLKWTNDAEASGVTLETVPLEVEAKDAFSANQLEAHLEAMAEIIGKNDPDKGKAEQDKQCWGCGKQTPESDHGGHKMACKVPGWVTIRRKGTDAPETWCPECAAMPGFGCVEEPE